MKNFSRILCATDFSEDSLRAVDYARSLALRFDADLILVTVVDDLPVTTPPIEGAPVAQNLDVATYQKQLNEEATTLMNRLMEENTSPDLRLRNHVVNGSPGRRIIQVAADEQADLIVMGTHGHGRFHRFIFGSVAERVHRSAPCPVLTVPPEDMD